MAILFPSVECGLTALIGSPMWNRWRLNLTSGGMGLGKAAVLEGNRRRGALVATVAYVGSAQEFYQEFGLRKIFNCYCWKKTLVG